MAKLITQKQLVTGKICRGIIHNLRFCIYSRPIIILILIACTLGLILENPSYAQNTKEYYWWDGDQKRPVQVIENVLIDVSNSSSNNKGLTQQKMAEKLQSLPGAFKMGSISKEGSFTKIQVKSRDFTQSIQQGLGNQFSPLFQDGPKVKALPGGVIITFKNIKTDEEVKAWTEAQGLKIKEKLGIMGGKTWLLDSAPGIASLELANQLHESTELEFSQPNWSHNN